MSTHGADQIRSSPISNVEQAATRDPLTTGYLLLAAAVEPTRGRSPFPRSTPRKTRLLARLCELVAVASGETQAKATLYQARFVPPPVGYDASDFTPHPSAYDVAVLLETESRDGLDKLVAAQSVRALEDRLRDEAADVLVMPARCSLTIRDVDKSRPGLFLFNYFTGPDPDVTRETWRHLAAWYSRTTGMDNSTLLEPFGNARFDAVNHARWDSGMARFAAKQFVAPNFRRDVIKVLRSARVVSRPIFYHRVSSVQPFIDYRSASDG